MIPEAFPNLNILNFYVAPVTSGSESWNVDIDADQMLRREVNIVKIAQCYESLFGWGYKEFIIEHFRRILWKGVCVRVRVLRRGVMDSEEEVAAHRPDWSYRGSNGNDIMSTPCKTGRRAHELAVETPSRLICSRDEYGGEGKVLLTRITCSTEHASTDGVLEYRVKVCPALLVRLVEGGINGTRSRSQDDLGPGTSEDEDKGEDRHHRLHMQGTGTLPATTTSPHPPTHHSHSITRTLPGLSPKARALIPLRSDLERDVVSSASTAIEERAAAQCSS